MPRSVVQLLLICGQLSAVSCLNKVISTASHLSDFTPALGHTYLPLAYKNATPASSFNTAQTSKESTPMPSAGTPRPDTQETASSKGSVAPKFAGDNDYQDMRMLAESWDLSLRYGNDYMDENPLVGEPGSFKLTKSRDLALASSTSSAASVPQPFKETKKKAAAPPIKTDLPMGKEKKGTPGTAKSPITPGNKEKKIRRKSKAAGVATPKVTTPKPQTPV